MWLFLPPTITKTGPIVTGSNTIALLLQVALLMGLRGYIASLLFWLWFISILLTTRGQELAGIVIFISVTIFAILIIATSMGI